MLRYSVNLKGYARELRKTQTDSERILWSRLRGKKLIDIQFYRQKPIGKYIVDFFAPKVKLVVEVDGSQHNEGSRLLRDQERDQYLAGLGLKVLRFNSREVLIETEAVLDVIYRTMTAQINPKIPLNPPFSKGKSILP